MTESSLDYETKEWVLICKYSSQDVGKCGVEIFLSTGDLPSPVPHSTNDPALFILKLFA